MLIEEWMHEEDDSLRARIGSLSRKLAQDTTDSQRTSLSGEKARIETYLKWRTKVKVDLELRDLRYENHELQSVYGWWISRFEDTDPARLDEQDIAELMTRLVEELGRLHGGGGQNLEPFDHGHPPGQENLRMAKAMADAIKHDPEYKWVCVKNVRYPLGEDTQGQFTIEQSKILRYMHEQLREGRFELRYDDIRDALGRTTRPSQVPTDDV
jgi:hypothetical protein